MSGVPAESQPPLPCDDRAAAASTADANTSTPPAAGLASESNDSTTSQPSAAASADAAASNDDVVETAAAPGLSKRSGFLDAVSIEQASHRVLTVGRIAVVGITLALFALLGRVYQLQQHPSERIAAMIDSQVTTSELNARRGSLVDRRHRVLATTRIAHLLFVDPDIVEDPGSFSETVGYALGYDPAWVEQQIFSRRGSRYIVLDKRMSDERYARYQDSAELQKLRGLASHSVLVRDYPQNRLAGQLVGFIGHEGNGLDGLEKAYESRLGSDPGQHAFVYDRGRRRLWLANQDYKLQADGKPIRLSVDLNLQAIAEEELAATVNAFKAESGQIVVMDPITGEILALANYPFFDPSDFRDENGKFRKDAKIAQRNRAVTDVFEPGSIVKPLIWAAAIEAGAAKSHEMIDTTDVGWWKPKRGPVLRDTQAHGTISWDHVLILSSNIGMARVAERMGKPALHTILTSYGFGQTTHSGLPGEVNGLLRKLNQWSHADLTRMPMGHGFAVTPLQVTRAFCAVANDGVLINPTIEARDNESDEQRRANITARVLSPRVAQHTREILGRVITEGTGRKARSELYDLFGKTGTAQLPDPVKGGYYKNQYISSFIAGGPLQQPRLVVGCFIHKPDKSIGHYGGTVSGPAVKRVMERSLLYLGVPTKPDDAVAEAGP